MSWASAARTSGRVVTGPGISSSMAGYPWDFGEHSHGPARNPAPAASPPALSFANSSPWSCPSRCPIGSPAGWCCCGIIVGLFVVLAYVCLPFAVFGVKGRLATMEARLDEIQGEIRSLSLRLPERHEAEYDPYEEPPAERGRAPRPESAPPRRPVIVRPPIPPRVEEDEATFRAAPPRSAPG